MKYAVILAILLALTVTGVEAKRRPTVQAITVPWCPVVSETVTLSPGSSETWTIEGCPAFGLWAAYAEIDKASVPFDTNDIPRYDVGLTVTAPDGVVFTRDTHDGWKEAFAYNDSIAGTWIVAVDNHGTNQFSVNVLAGGQ